jgi:putative DNA primase/helicase
MFTQIDFSELPHGLLASKTWVVWRFMQHPDRPKPDKRPFQPLKPRFAASHSDPNHWSSFQEAKAVFDGGGFHGLGFVFTQEAGITGIDLDGVIADGVMSPIAEQWIHLFDSYTERSPSGRGVHIFVYPGWLASRHRVKAAFDLEVYTSQRFFTMTGQRYDLTSKQIENRSGELLLLERRFLPELPIALQPSVGSRVIPLLADDVSLIAMAVKKSGGSALQTLLYGDVINSGFITKDGQPDESAADLALCNRLYFWTGGDVLRVDRIFRSSGLYRPKWDQKRGDKTYGEMTLERVAQTSRQVFQGHLGKLSQ